MSFFEDYVDHWSPQAAQTFWKTPASSALIGELRERFVDAVLARFASRMKSRCPLEKEEVLASLVLLLMDSDKMTKIAGCDVDDPAAYFCVTAANEIVRKELGTLAHGVEDEAAVFRSDATVDVPEVESLEVLVATPQGDIAALPTARTGDLTPLGEACKAATNYLVNYLPARAVSDLRLVVDWFALNPPQHRGHGHSQAAREPFLRELGLSEKQAMAFAKILWGTRYREPETSLLGWYLKHPGRSPRRSKAHSDALVVFHNEMATTQATVRRSVAS